MDSFFVGEKLLRVILSPAYLQWKYFVAPGLKMSFTDTNPNQVMIPWFYDIH